MRRPTASTCRLNSHIVQALLRTQNASTANNISAVVAPRVIRAGVKLTW